MLRILKLVVTAAGLAAFAWFGLTVPLGERTLFQHIAAIGQSKESQELLRGTKEKVGEVSKRLGGGDGKATAPQAEPRQEAKPEAKAEAKTEEKAEARPAPNTEGKAKAEAPQERLTQADRDGMQRLLKGSARKK